MVNTVLFDFDGTVMDTNKVIIESWQHTYRTLTGHDGNLDYILATFGEPLELSMENAFPDIPADESVNVYRTWHGDNYMQMIKMFPGVMDLLIEIKKRGYKTGIATSRLEKTLYQGLEKYNITKYFDAIVTVEDIPNPKPEPDTVISALRKLDSRPESAVMVGDTRLDILCARNAGVMSVLVGWSASLAGKTKEDFAPGEAPDFIIDKPNDLLDII